LKKKRNANEILSGKLAESHPLGVQNRLQVYTEMNIRETNFNVENEGGCLYCAQRRNFGINGTGTWRSNV
jgi:hypothetical protein